MKISGVDIRPGNIIEFEGSHWRATRIQHTQPGKGGAYMQVELKNVYDGRKNNNRFRSSETVERVRLDPKDYQYLFGDETTLTFMDAENFEQIEIPADMIEDERPFLEDGMPVVIEFIEDRPVSIQLPEQVTCTINEADPVVKGQTATSSYKPAMLTNGVRVMVPPFVGSGEAIVVNVYTREYVRRAD